MRIVVCHPGPAYSVADVYQGWVKGLRECGETVAEFNLGERFEFYSTSLIEYDKKLINPFTEEQAFRLAAMGLAGKCFYEWPDVVVVISAFFVPPEFYDVLHSRGMKVVIIHTESPYEDDSQLIRASKADLNILNDPTNIDRFREVAPTVYAPHAFDPDRHHPQPRNPKLASDFFFCGTGYKSRIEFFEQCDLTGLDVKIAGNWTAVEDTDSWLRQALIHKPDECMFNDETAEYYCSTRSSVNLYRKESNKPELSEGWAMGPREVELAACGTFFLREPREEGDHVLQMVPTFESPEEFTSKLRWWLYHDEQRQIVTDAARAAVQDRTFTANAARLLTNLDA